MRIRIDAANRSVAVEDGRIVPVEGRFDARLTCRDADIRPGLINGHDHLHRNHYGRLGKPPYANAYRWAEDIQRRYRRRIARGRAVPRREALLVGAWKNLFSGVTTVVHHDPWEADFERDFPIRVARVDCADSVGMSGDAVAPSAGPFCLHVAEGVDRASADELPELERRGMLNSRLLAVHGVGADREGIKRFRAAGAALVWCPTSNLFLFGRTAARALLEEGIDVILGSDSRLTANGDLLDEARSAHSERLVDGHRLDAATGDTAAKRLGLCRPSLEPGAPADLVLIARPVGQASANDVALTMVGGIPRVVRDDLAGSLEPLGIALRRSKVGAVERWIYGGAERPLNRRNEQ